MTRDELIARLKEFPPDRQVYIDGGKLTCAAAKTGTIYTGYIWTEEWFQPDYVCQKDETFRYPVIIISI